MKLLLDELRAAGCEVDATMDRLLNDEAFYADCLNQMMNDRGFEALGQALETHSIREAFANAHMLKGVAANLGVTSIYEILSEIVEQLRAGSDEGLQEKYKAVDKQRERYRKILEETS